MKWPALNDPLPNISSRSGRNKEFLDNAADYAQAVVISAEILRLFPSWLKG